MKLFTRKHTTLLIAKLVLAIDCTAMAQSPQQTADLRAGTPITLVFSDNVSSANASVGDTVALTLVNDLVVGRNVVATSGTKEMARVTTVTKAKAPGRSGAISLHLEPLHAGNMSIPLRAGMKDETDVHYERPYHLKFPMGLVRTGDDVEVRSNTSLTVYVAEDVHLPTND